jgi:hypothetical protein
MPVNDMCLNLECPIGSGAELPRYDVVFDFCVKLSDHTGSLENVHLCGIAAERVIGYKVRKSHNVKTIVVILFTVYVHN